ncbi:MAG: DUF2256 domain-containing protein [Cyclobacteriaceae bacterium]|nr:DUF2256 domain-containing protein [Cyclobacteriaceae bacterium]
MKHQKKSDLPQKICLVCDRPFSWRKKWKNVWEEVRYCSEHCRSRKDAKTHE